METALITGASKGIGKAIAEELGGRGYNLLLVARSAELLLQAANEFREKFNIDVDILAIDLSLPDSPEKVLYWCKEKNYNVTILVNNAGYGLSGQFDKYSVAENVNMVQLNIVALVKLCQLFLPQLKQRSKSYILNIASSAAYQAVPFLSLYSASKSFVLSFSRGLRQELKKTSVSLTCISPGSTDTDFVVRAQLGEKGLKTASKVNMTPKDVAHIAVNSLFAGKAEVVVGFLNKLGAFMAWLMPKGLVETTAMKIYE
ncbi:MAG TPA: SDR family oxidoreductase [Puia sp.]|nr:SDR family oxidoreductase [Puia sp.]